jgi:flagellar motility protein MotE (MotC chaperone)
MAKKAKKPEEETIEGETAEKPGKKRKKRGSKGGKIVAAIITFVVLGGLTAVIVFNPLDLRQRYITPVVKNIPVINRFTDMDDGGSTRAELEAVVETLQLQLEREKRANYELSEKSEQYVHEISRLRDIEAQQLKFKADKEKFESMIAMSDPKAYAEFYESISPENALELYADAIEDARRAKEFKKYINAIQALEDDAGAKILEWLATTDMNLVVTILRGVDPDKCGAILTVMETRTAADIVKQMSV